MAELPNIMVAPNGARRSQADHPALPVTIRQIVDDARACFVAGAGGLHAHVRDAAGRHTLDAGLYRELLGELALAVPHMVVQVTTEAVGIYSPAEQRALVQDLRPAQVSVALREMSAGESAATLRAFYHWTAGEGVGVQHILYSPEEVVRLEHLVAGGVVPAERLEVIFVLGAYQGSRDSRPEDLEPFLAARRGAISDARWMVCAFGRHETECLVAAVRAGGKARIGFENNILNADGTMASGNAERVGELVHALRRGVPR